MSSVSISMLDESISIPPSNIQTKKVSSNNIWSQIINSFSASRLLIAATIAGLIIVTGVLITSLLSQSIMNDLYHDIETVFTLASASAPFFNAWSGMIPSAAPQITRTFTVYTITNANDILQGAKPNIQELPPITYIVYQEKRSPLWDQDQFYDTVRYTPYTSYTFADNTSAQVANTLVTTINLPLLMAVTFPIVAYIIATTPILAARYLDNEQALFIQRPAHEVIFGWKNDPFFNDFNTHKPFWSFSLPTNVDGFFQNDTTLNEAIKYHHTIRMNTGIVNPAKISYMEAWNGDSNLICCAFGDCNAKDSAGSISALPWNDGYANTIDGSDGSLFLDRVDCSQQLLLGAYDFGIFRHVNLECNTAPQNIPPIPVNYTTYIQSTDKPGENKKNRNSSDEDDDANFSPNYSINGISVLSFQLTISSFQNATTNPDIGTSYFQYGPNGLMNLSMCYNGIPIFFSKPRFLDGDASLANGIENLEAPTRLLHDTFLGIEPNTGASMEIHWRSAINIYLQPIQVLNGSLIFFQGINSVYLPLLWYSHDSIAAPYVSNFIVNTVYPRLVAVRGAYWGGIVSAILGGGVVIAVLAISLCRRRIYSTDNTIGISFALQRALLEQKNDDQISESDIESEHGSEIEKIKYNWLKSNNQLNDSQISKSFLVPSISSPGLN